MNDEKLNRLNEISRIVHGHKMAIVVFEPVKRKKRFPLKPKKPMAKVIDWNKIKKASEWITIECDKTATNTTGGFF